MTTKARRAKAADAATPKLPAHEKEVQSLKAKISELERRIRGLEAACKTRESMAIAAMKRVDRAHTAIEIMGRVMTNIANRARDPDNADLPF